MSSFFSSKLNRCHAALMHSVRLYQCFTGVFLLGSIECEFELASGVVFLQYDHDNIVLRTIIVLWSRIYQTDTTQLI